MVQLALLGIFVKDINPNSIVAIGGRKYSSPSSHPQFSQIKLSSKQYFTNLRSHFLDISSHNQISYCFFTSETIINFDSFVSESSIYQNPKQCFP